MSLSVRPSPAFLKLGLAAVVVVIVVVAFVHLPGGLARQDMGGAGSAGLPLKENYQWGKDGDPLTHMMQTQKHRESIKWTHYMALYDRHFNKFRGKKMHILEIGVRRGGSLQMWKKYFGAQAMIYGVDIDPNTKKFEEEQVKIFIGDQKNRTFLRELRSKLPKLDILIDDGGHTMEQQKRTFEELFGHVTNDGGVFWCEDLHTSYWKEMFDGPKNAPPFVDIAKTWVDLLNAHHSRGKFKPNDITEHARGIHFYDSVVVIEKQPRRNVKAVTFAR